jgi:hypothetical protein
VVRVELARAAVEDLDVLIRTHSLPADTRARVARSLRALERFPHMGPALNGRWEAFRFILGPWRWLLLVYVFIEPENRVVIVTVQDARSSTAATKAVPGLRRFEAARGVATPDGTEVPYQRIAELTFDDVESLQGGHRVGRGAGRGKRHSQLRHGRGHDLHRRDRRLALGRPPTAAFA